MSGGANGGQYAVVRKTNRDLEDDRGGEWGGGVPLKPIRAMEERSPIAENDFDAYLQVIVENASCNCQDIIYSICWTSTPYRLPKKTLFP